MSFVFPLHATRHVPSVIKAALPIALGILLCSCQRQDEGRPASSGTETVTLPPEQPFVVRYSPSQTYSQLRRDYQQNQFMENLLGEVNNLLVLPSDLKVQYRECGEDNAFYDAETRTVNLCYEILQWIRQTAASQSDHAAEQMEYADNLLTFYTLHELGHALIDVYSLPITGRKEDVADQIAVYLLSQEGQQAILDAGASFYANLEGVAAEALPFADEHALDRQRYYNLLCWLYGTDEKSHHFLVKEGYLDQERAELCPYEFARLEHGIENLLQNHIRAISSQPAAR